MQRGIRGRPGPLRIPRKNASKQVNSDTIASEPSQCCSSRKRLPVEEDYLSSKKITDERACTHLRVPDVEPDESEPERDRERLLELLFPPPPSPTRPVPPPPPIAWLVLVLGKSLPVSAPPDPAAAATAPPRPSAKGAPPGLPALLILFLSCELNCIDTVNAMTDGCGNFQSSTMPQILLSTPY